MTENRVGSSLQPTFRLDERVVVVLGGGDGIGRETSRVLAGAGAKVVVVDRNPSRATTVAQETDGLALSADVTQRDELAQVFASTIADLGRVDGLVDIVGAAQIKPLREFNDEEWDSQFDLVLRHAFLAIQLGSAAMNDHGGAMVFVGSTSGDSYTTGQSAYGTAKAALHHLVECAGRELGAEGIRVNAVAPGYTRTPRLEEALSRDAWAGVEAKIPRGKAAAPSEIAGPIAFLLSEAASYVTGQVLTVDGGISGHVPSF